MVAGIFAGYNFDHRGKLMGDYYVYDAEAYENWTGSYSLLLRTTKELYLPGQAPDSKDELVYIFPAAGGETKPRCKDVPKYVPRRKKFITEGN